MDRAAELFDRVGIQSARTRLRAYPHQFSGGMAQRVMIAMAIATRPRLLLADEPTTALDVSVQDQVLDLLEDLRQAESMSMIIVSHDIGVIARTCDVVVVMYAGGCWSGGPWTRCSGGRATPTPGCCWRPCPASGPTSSGQRLASIGGQLPDLATLSDGCPFAPRCSHALPSCSTLPVELDQPIGLHASACPVV